MELSTTLELSTSRSAKRGIGNGMSFGVDLGGDRPEPPGRAPLSNAARDEKTLIFTKKVLGTTEVVWKDAFAKMGKSYTPPHLDLFSNQVRTGCGLAPAAVGPFY